MTRIFFAGAVAASLLLVATVSASAQSSVALTNGAVATPSQPVAGGAAGQMSYLAYTWENVTARLGLNQSGQADTSAPTRTASSDTH